MQSYNPEVTTYNILAKIMWKHNISRLSLIPLTTLIFNLSKVAPFLLSPPSMGGASKRCMQHVRSIPSIIHTLQPVINVKSSCVQYVSLIPNIIHALECIQIHQHTVDVG